MSERNLVYRLISHRLIEPHPRVTGPDRQRRARITAILALTLMILTLVLTIIPWIVVKQRDAGAIILFSLLVATFLFSRTPWPEIGAGLLTFGLTISSLITLALFPNPTVTPQAMVFTLLPVLLSTLIMTSVYTLLLAALNTGGLILLIALAPWLDFQMVMVPFVATVLLSTLAAAASYVVDRDLATIRQQSEEMDRYSQSMQQEAQRLSAIADVGRAITGVRDLDELLRLVTNLIVERFDFYHAQVFLLDETRRYAVLRASTGEVGRQLLARGHRLSVGSQSVIGQVTSRGAPVIASDTDVDPIHRRNELLPNTRSEMALPLRVGNNVIGALDIQSVKPNAFRDEDVSTFQSIADQLAVAIENARLFERAQRDLRDIETLNRQLTGEAWRRYVTGRSSKAPIGFEVSDRGVTPLLPGEASASQAGQDDGALSVPLTVRGQSIGVIDLKPRDGLPPDEETQALLQAVAERVALALDSTRLSDHAQRQAEREQILSRLSAELQATTDLDVILRIAAREASRALDSPRGFIRLTMEYGPPEEPARET